MGDRKIVGWVRTGERRAPKMHEPYFTVQGELVVSCVMMFDPGDIADRRDIARPVFENAGAGGGTSP